MNLHPKIAELRASIGYLPMHEFVPNRKKYEAVPVAQRSPVTSKEGEDRQRLIKQYFAIWGIPDDYGTRPVRGCFGKSIQERGPGTKATNKIVVLNQHNQRSPLCLPEVLKEDETGLYGEYEPDPDIEENDTLIKRVTRGTINGGSYGFQYVWDKMEWNEKDECIDMHECELLEVSPVTFGSQKETYVVRNSKTGKFEDEFLEDETEELVSKIPRQHRLEMRSLISRHISLAKMQPTKGIRTSLKDSKPKQRGLDLGFLTELISD